MIRLAKNGAVAEIIIDNPDAKVNTLTMAAMKELSEVIDSIQADSSLTCCVVKSAKKDMFIAGADIKEIQHINTQQEAYELVKKGQGILDKLAALSIPTIAAIHGPCLGGGLELALACDYRIATLHPKTQLGLPEVNLGIIPGFGGTQRLPRLVGLIKSLSLILPGKAVDAKKAKKLSLIDGYSPVEFFDHYTQDFVKSIQSLNGKAKKRRNKSSIGAWFMERTFLGRFLVHRSAKKNLLKKTKGNYPAPLAALNVIVSGAGTSLKKGLDKEAKAFSKCIETPVSSHLISLFFSQEAQKKLNVSGAESRLPQLKQAAVLGAGLMGGGIAWTMAYRQLPVLLKDIRYDAALSGVKAVADIMGQLKKIRKVTAHEVTQTLHRVLPVIDYKGFHKVDVVIEAVIEKVPVKQHVYQECEAVLPRDAIIATNTSSLSIDELASKLEYPERFVGMHFFSPVNRMPLVEVIPGDKTSPETVATIVDLVKKMKKVPVVVKNCPGFLVNRILLPYVNEAMYCLQDGASISQIDKVLVDFGMPVGPLTLGDEVGLDVGLKVLKVLEEGYGSRMALPDYVQSLSQNDAFCGKKTGQGFYIYEGKQKRENPAVKALVRSSDSLNSQDIEDRCLFVMVNEAFRCLNEGVVGNVQECDLAMIMGTGFPPFRGGLIAYANSVGLSHIVDRLNEFVTSYGDRFSPCDYLVECASQNSLPK